MSDYIGELRKLIGTSPIIMCGANVIILDNCGRILLHHRDICKDFSDQILVDENEGKDASFFSVKDIPEKISPPVRAIIDDFINMI